MAKFISWLTSLIKKKPTTTLEPVATPVAPVVPIQPAPAVFTPSFSNGVSMTLKRTYQDKETLGAFFLADGTEFCKTLERPWLDNKPFVSCIPEGTYTVKRVVKTKHGECFEIQNVPGRDSCLIHWGNYVTDVEGCILVGLTYADLNGDNLLDVTSSKTAYQKFMTHMTGVAEFKLVIQKA